MQRAAGPAGDRRLRSELARLGALWAIAMAAAAAIGPRGPVYWDTFGYLTQALTGQVGGLGLGRPVFVLVSHVVTRAALDAGLSVWSVEPLLRSLWLVVAASAAPATCRLARECGLSRAGSLASGLAVALSPAMAHTSAAVLTDAPALAVAVWALATGARAVRVAAGDDAGRVHAVRLALLAGALAGLACGVREQSASAVLTLVAMVPAARPSMRLRLAASIIGAAVLVVALPIVVVAVTQPAYWETVRGWLDAMERESGAPFGLRLAAMAAWLVALGPIALVAAASVWLRTPRVLWRPWRPLSAVVVVAMAQLIALAWYPDLTYSPRYLLPVLPGVIAIPAGVAWMRVSRAAERRVGVVSLVASVALLIAARAAVDGREDSLRRVLQALPQQLAEVPAAAVVTGQPCPAIAYIMTAGRVAAGGVRTTDGWEAICPGWAWPADLAARLDAIRASGRRVVVDLRQDAWMGQEQRRARDEARHYVDGRRAGVADGSIVVWRE